ncbi:MAG: tetratricopeptide repeat protein [Candidatus Eisenbacteria bacterium]
MLKSGSGCANVVAKMRYLLERGRVYNSSKDTGAAKPLFLEAWEAGLAAGEDDHALDAAHMMAIVEPPEQQLVWAEKAMALAEETTDEHAGRWLGPPYNNTGWSYHDLGQYDKALELFEKSLAFRQERGDVEGTRIAKWTIARTYRSLGRVDEAQVYFRQAHEILSQDQWLVANEAERLERLKELGAGATPPE